MTAVTDPAPTGAEKLALGYARCAELTRAHGTTYYWGTALLKPAQRRDVYAVYALCRLADDIVDEPDRTYPGVPADGTPAERLSAFRGRFEAAVARGDDDDPVMAAVVDSLRRRGTPLDCFERFFDAMALDLTVTSYPTWPSLRDNYMEGSAAVIGEMMLPVLEPLSPAAREPARSLGLAFQLTNFIRDVEEDLDRGRFYLPLDELASEGADPHLRRVTPQWRRFLAGQIRRNRELYVEAGGGLRLLPPASRRCVGAAMELYARILDRVEAADYDVFSGRVRVPRRQKLATVVRSMVLLPEPGRSARGGGDPPGDAPGDPARGRPKSPLVRCPQPAQSELTPTWRLARPGRIARSLARAEERDPGGWLVAAPSHLVGQRSVVRRVADREVALWRGEGGALHAGPGACPHLGAQLSGCAVAGDGLVCRWHGMVLPDDAGPGWSEWPVHDDGVLAWIRLPVAGEEPTEQPVLGPRPPLDRSVVAVVETSGRCEPRDIIANRLDPWHGAWFHPKAFSHLTVDETRSNDDELYVEVTFRINRTWGVPVVARFATPDARTISMDIVEGEGRGSVVETHATPQGTDGAGAARTMVTEATIAHSDRRGFAAATGVSALLRPVISRTAAMLWVDDLEYAERLYALRTGLVPESERRPRRR